MLDGTTRNCSRCGEPFTKKPGPGRWPAGCPACAPEIRKAEAKRRRKGKPGKKPNVPCSGCGKLLYTSSTSLPPDRRLCQPCRRARRGQPGHMTNTKAQRAEATCNQCGDTYLRTRGNQRYCPPCRGTRKNLYRPKPPLEQSITGRPRTRATAQVRATQPDCHLCGIGPIDLTLDRQRHPLSSCVDELVPRSQGGSPLDPANLRHAHRICNGSRGTQPITPEVRQRCRDLVMQHLNGVHGTLDTW